MKHNTKPQGFTLIELLIAITIIAILAGVALPAGQQVMEAARKNAALQHARQISLGMRIYATEENGVYPSTADGNISTANDAFRKIIDYVERDERIFVVPGSAWGSSVDNKTDSPAEILKAGENHFAFIAGLDSTARPYWPLIVDGTDGAGTYNENASEKGGRWQGRTTVVAHVDGSASSVRLEGPDGAKFVPKHDDNTANALNVSYMGASAVLLDPAG